MILVGSTLKKIRLSKKIKLITVLNDLKISRSLIEQIEKDNFKKESGITYLIGHIRAYSNYLDLDSDEVIKKFKEQTSFINYIPLQVIAKPMERKVFFLSFNSLSLISVLFISVGFYFLFIKPNDLNPKYASIPDLPESLIAQIEEIEMNENLNNVSIINTLEDVDKKFLDKDNYDFTQISKNSAIASIPKETEIQNDDYRIALKFLKPTWIQLRNSEEEIVLSKLMNKNDEYTYLASEKYFLTVGNAGNILLLINEDSRGKLGKNGEVVESLMINSEFNN